MHRCCGASRMCGMGGGIARVDWEEACWSPVCYEECVIHMCLCHTVLMVPLGGLGMTAFIFLKGEGTLCCSLHPRGSWARVGYLMPNLQQRSLPSLASCPLLLFLGPVTSVICLHSRSTNLLRYSWHIINCAHLKCPIGYILICEYTWEIITTIMVLNIFPKVFSCPIVILPSAHPHPCCCCC